MTTFYDLDVLKRLETKYIDVQGIKDYYCDIKKRHGSCPKQLGFTCEACYPQLHKLLTSGLDDDYDRLPGLLRWRISQYALGKLSVWMTEPNQSPRRSKSSTDTNEDASFILDRMLGKTSDKRPVLGKRDF